MLRRHFGIEPEDAVYRREGWAIDLLLEGLRQELNLGGDQPDPNQDPFGEVPEQMKGV